MPKPKLPEDQAKTHLIGVRIEHDLHVRVHEAAKNQRVSFSQGVRDALDIYAEASVYAASLDLPTLAVMRQALRAFKANAEQRADADQLGLFEGRKRA